jgi:hypothetical protein
MALNGYSGKLGTQNKSVKELNFHGSVNCDEIRKRIQLQRDSCEVKEVAVEMMVNGSSPDTQMFMHGGFKMAKVIFAKVKFVENMCMY